MSEFDDNLKPRQVRAIKALLTEKSIKAAAGKAGVADVTLHRWLAEPVFCAALREARGRMLEGVLTIVQGLGEKAAETLRDIMDDSEAHAGSRVRAALGALATIIKAREVLETEERLRAIEERIAALKPAQKLRAVR